jgi:hypothetical protein
MDLYSVVAEQIAALRAEYAAAKSDGKVTAAEMFRLFTVGIEALVKAASALSMPGAEKKAAVMEAVAKLYDEVLAPIDLPYVPEFVEASVLDPALKKLALLAADGLVEFFVAKLPA